jgi:two-component system CitB family response regulator
MGHVAKKLYIAQPFLSQFVKPLVFERLNNTLQNYKEFRHKLRKIKQEKQSVDQEQIDELMKGSTQTEQKNYSLPKPREGIDKITLEKVLTAIKQCADGLSAEEMGKKIGISGSTTRRYLEYLPCSKRTNRY